MITIETFVRFLDLGGTFVFAISGAVAAVNRRLDIFGILVISFVTGNFGGITRDLLIGAVPPAALTDARYLLVSVLAGVIIFFWRSEEHTSELQSLMRISYAVFCLKKKNDNTRLTYRYYKYSST